MGMKSRPCPRTTQAGQPCRNTVSVGRPDCGRHVVDPSDWSVSFRTGPAAVTSDPMAPPAAPDVLSRPVAATGPRIPDHQRTTATLERIRGRQATEIGRLRVPDDTDVGHARYMAGRDAVVAWVAGGTEMLRRTGDGRAGGPVPVTVGGIVGRIENGRMVWRNGRTIEEGDIVESHRTFPTAQAALDDLTGTAEPATTGRFGHYGPHHATTYDDAMALLLEHRGHVTSHRDPYGTADATVVDADIWRDGADMPVLAVSIAYDNHGAEVRAWWAHDTYPSASALAELTAHRTSHPNPAAAA